MSLTRINKTGEPRSSRRAMGGSPSPGSVEPKHYPLRNRVETPIVYPADAEVATTK